MKVLAIVQARLDSTRLPGKVLLLIQGKPILEHIIDFLKYSRLIDQIIVATTNLPQDDKIEQLTKHLGIACYRGSSTNVLERYYECAKSFKGDLIVRITSDNPLIDPSLIDEVIRICKETQCDYATNYLRPSYPVGYSTCEVFTFEVLRKLYETQQDPLSKEHVTYAIKQNPRLYKIRELLAPSTLARPGWRLTVDYKEDFRLISEIFGHLYKTGSFIRYESVVHLLDTNPSLLKINAKHYNT